MLDNIMNTIINRLINDDDLFKAVYFEQPDFLNQTIPSNRSIIVEDRIFPYIYVPDLVKEVKTFITIEVDVEYTSKTISDNKIHFYVLTHFSNETTAYEIKRTRFIMDRLKDLFHLADDIGISKTMLADENKFTTGSLSYIGFDVQYSMKEFI